MATRTADAMTFKRIGAMMYLSDVYAPQGKAGAYMVMTECSAMHSGFLTVVGHIIKVGDQLQRVWMGD